MTAAQQKVRATYDAYSLIAFQIGFLERRTLIFVAVIG